MENRLKIDFKQILDHSHINNPYPLYEQFRKTPVAQQEDGSYLVSTYNEIVALLHDPRVSSDMRKSDAQKRVMQQAAQKRAEAIAQGLPVPEQEEVVPPFIFQDPPNHDRLRRIVMSQFTPERIGRVGEHIKQIVKEHLDKHAQGGQIDIVDDLAYPLPVTVICQLLGVPREDEAHFHSWSEILASVLDPGQAQTDAQLTQIMNANKQIHEYMQQLLQKLKVHPGDNLLSGLLAARDDEGAMSSQELIATAILLLIAGHETTVNLITNGTLAMLRSPQLLAHLRQKPELIVPYVEELLRYDPPVHFRNRTALADITIAGTTIPQGATIILVLASGNHDEKRFEQPEECLIDRQGNEHLGFGSGIHYCVGAPLARIEAQIALGEISRRLIKPELAIDPPPYRDNAALRGPRHLLVNFQGLSN
ncbi:cytochrome P450 [Tengunoibacter tsumagoiensis]|uniref:Cytochrome P450 n=1 Tax=Tengunoibacter tsumagoiensis TaxID=2014871 RepID=A0A402A6Z3_9CHLR|nr:cytochrome P450 [Tengunoibacter tsumagoiensis]GCE14903.1 cytochrome P450 [Tengunoibacter tsumagoiensis]